jgi:hypothetical protein
MRRMSSDLRIVPSESRYLESFCSTLDAVARERRYLMILEAPSLDGILQFVAENQRRGGVQFFAVDSADQVVGWCDVNRHRFEGHRHCGALGMGLSTASSDLLKKVSSVGHACSMVITMTA